MYRFTLGILTIIGAASASWSVLEKHLFTAGIYLGITIWLYLKLEKDVFRG